jgi:bacillithiol biosynthesis cysteine-adding enzyme BshC
MLRDRIPFHRFPWIRPLVEAYVHAFPTVASLFEGDPADPTVWRSMIARAQAHASGRELMAGVLERQLRRRGAAGPAIDAAASLNRPETVVIITGQQAGLFGGPLYTLLKAVTTVQLARHVREQYGVATVPVFWVDAEDHDWDEVRTAHLLTREAALTSVSLDDLDGCRSRPVGTLRLNGSAASTVDQLAAELPPTEFTSDLVETLRRRYATGETVGSAFAGWMDDLLGAEGLVVFEANDPEAKPLAAGLFVEELAHPVRTARLARETGARMTALGHAPQVEPAEDAVGLFYLDEQGRRSIRYREGQFLVGDEPRDPSALQAEAAADPARFSPNVLLRAIVQDRLFPSVAYVAGPAELAYQAQLRPVYEAFGVPAPLLCSRASATLLDAAAVRFLDKQGLPLEALQPQDESALNRLLEAQLPPSLERTFLDTERHIAELAAGLKQTLTPIDPTLAGAVDTTVERVRETFRTLHNKIVQASKKKDETLRRQFMRTRALAFPGGQPQERLLCLAFFINRYGPTLPSRLIEALPPIIDAHYVLTP